MVLLTFCIIIHLKTTLKYLISIKINSSIFWGITLEKLIDELSVMVIQNKEDFGTPPNITWPPNVQLKGLIF